MPLHRKATERPSVQVAQGGSPGARKSSLSLLPPVDRIEQELERAARLSAHQNLRAIEEHASLAHLRIDCNHAFVEVRLAPGPAAAQRRRRIEPRDGCDTLGLRICAELP